MSYQKKYSHCLGKLFTTWFENQNKEYLKKRFDENYYWTLFGDELNDLSDEELDFEDNISNDETYKILRFLSYGLGEILDSIQVLRETRIYIKSFPFAEESQITKIGYFRRNIEKYIEEMYILKERLINYISNIKTMFSDYLLEESNSLLTKAEVIVKETLHPITGYGKVRGRHVHEKRYSSPNISRLINLNHFTQIPNIENELKTNFQNYLDEEYQKIRDDWIERIEEELSVIDEMLEKYFFFLYGVLFDDECDPIFPFY